MKISFDKIKERTKGTGTDFLVFFIEHISVSLMLILLAGVGFAAKIFYDNVWLVEKETPQMEVRVQKIKNELLISVTNDLEARKTIFEKSGLPEKRDLFRQ